MIRILSFMMLLRRFILSPNLERLTVMKKIYIALAVVATALLSSCEKEKEFKDVKKIGEKDIAFVLTNSVTRSAEAVSMQKGITVPVGVNAKGEALFLEETIENLNPAPATKGAPAYTVNVGTLYPDMGVYSDFFGDASFEKMDDEIVGKGWRYWHNYANEPWPSDPEKKLDFFLRMPVIDEEFTYSNADRSVAFDYTSTANGASQQDILFGHTSISHRDHQGYLPNGAPVMMYHALTGVKFRSASENGSQTKTIITKVAISGLKGAGHCVVTFDANDAASVVWSNLGAGPEKFTLEYENPTYSAQAWVDGTVNFEKGENPKFGDSWYSAAADHNLNNEDGELTFWFIPQEMTDDVKLEVTFCVKTPDTATASGGGFETHTIELGKKINEGRDTPVKWDAGQLRTYTLNPKLVDVEIFDTMVGLKKSGLHVTNTGNVSEYVRMMVIGNWYGWASQDDADAGKEPMILVGYTHADPSNTEMVDPWFRENHKYGQYFDDTFTDGRPVAAKGNEWIFGTGSYFYYPNIIGPNDALATTSALFQSYELPQSVIPTIYIPTSSSSTRVEAVGVHLVMEVVIQAIGAQKPDGTGNYETWQEAWSAATGEEIDVKN